MKLVVEDLTFAYGSKKVLDGARATFESDKIYGIVGKNGVGKTTFFKALTNIITNYKGSIVLDDRNVRDHPEILAKTGILLDDIEPYKAYTGWFNLRYFGGLRGGLDLEMAEKIADELEIASALNQKVSTYSLGMSKKLLLLISLMNDAELLIFDEPFRGIDAKSVEWFRNYLLDLKNKGKLILISSHVQEDIESLCDEVRVLSDGKFAAPFDLTDSAQVLIYNVEVNDPAILAEILSNEGITSRQFDKMVKFESNTEKFQEIFKCAVERGLVFDVIKKESKFAEFVK